MIALDSQVAYVGQEKAVLVGVYNREVTKEKAEEYLEELQLLTKTAGAATFAVFLQKMDRVHSGTYVGKGKLAEIKAYVDLHKIDLVVFDDDLYTLAGAQHRP